MFIGFLEQSPRSCTWIGIHSDPHVQIGWKTQSSVYSVLPKIINKWQKDGILTKYYSCLEHLPDNLTGSVVCSE